MEHGRGKEGASQASSYAGMRGESQAFPWSIRTRLPAAVVQVLDLAVPPVVSIRESRDPARRAGG